MSNNPWGQALLLAGAKNPDASVMQHQVVEASLYSHKCPRCGSHMERVKLSASSDREVMYCTRDRVVVPIPVTN